MNSEKSIGLISANFNFIDSEGKQEKIKINCNLVEIILII